MQANIRYKNRLMTTNLICLPHISKSLWCALNRVNCGKGVNPNPQLSNMNSIIKVILKAQRLTGEEILTNNPDTSARHFIKYKMMR